MEQALGGASRRLGLALSGGGFRASYFHIGVLARLAEMGLLRHVEAISTVSGGSILGVLYYLRLKWLLESKPDPQITDADYVEVVRWVQERFHAGVQRNMRLLALAKPGKVWRMFTSVDYSLSDRLGEIYDQYLYQDVFSPRRPTPLTLADLLIRPMGEDGRQIADFHPAKSEGAGSRQAKVPILMINATVLNNGHPWLFEGTQMGSPLGNVGPGCDLDKTRRLHGPIRYEQLPERLREFSLGAAVAASACVPGLFPPLAITGLYEGVQIQLVDGGVVDNQGVQALIDRACTDFIVSDACGQLRDDDNPQTANVPVVMRQNSILMERVRQDHVLDLARCKSPLAFLHLRKGVAVGESPFLDAAGFPSKAPRACPQGDCLAAFGVDPRVQDLLSRIRTDLDSFTDIEAYSLANDGYLMADRHIPKEIRALSGGGAAGGGWPFQIAGPCMRDPARAYLEHLDIAGSQLFKYFLFTPRKQICLALGVLLFLVLLAWLAGRAEPFVLTVSAGAVLTALLAGAAGLLFSRLGWKTSAKLVNLVSGLRSLPFYLGALLAGLCFVNWYLDHVDRRFLENGRIWPPCGRGGAGEAARSGGDDGPKE